MPSKRDSWANRWSDSWKRIDPRATERWEILTSEGKSPREVWEIRFKELSEINGNFESKLPYMEYTPSESKTSIGEDHEFTVYEQVGLLFMKPQLRESQARWETYMNEGKSPEEFWRNERQLMSDNKSWWSSWTKRCENRTADCQSKYVTVQPSMEFRNQLTASSKCKNSQIVPQGLKLFKEFDFW